MIGDLNPFTIGRTQKNDPYSDLSGRAIDGMATEGQYSYKLSRRATGFSD